ncbi:hypothetical protein K227x_21010 [Rubripirellula lacrimiformis]|uniref:Uncharacterized protein n=1 Tax=Rubripirellula lacrimiformis TaxID=1930273 RepID=A0A517N998_9BACT|nr:hypothetical protein K227x_21010 [Rubripirellula lacrimiformis]
MRFQGQSSIRVDLADQATTEPLAANSATDGQPELRPMELRPMAPPQTVPDRMARKFQATENWILGDRSRSAATNNPVGNCQTRSGPGPTRSSHLEVPKFQRPKSPRPNDQQSPQRNRAQWQTASREVRGARRTQFRKSSDGTTDMVQQRNGSATKRVSRSTDTAPGCLPHRETAMMSEPSASQPRWNAASRIAGAQSCRGSIVPCFGWIEKTVPDVLDRKESAPGPYPKMPVSPSFIRFRLVIS